MHLNLRAKHQQWNLYTKYIPRKNCMKNELLLVIFKYGASMYEKRDIMHQTLLPWHFLDRGRFSFFISEGFPPGHR